LRASSLADDVRERSLESECAGAVQYRRSRRKTLEHEAPNFYPRAPFGPSWPHPRVFADDLEGARDFPQEDCTETSLSCFVPSYRVVQIADRPGVEVDSQELAGLQSALDSSACFGPVFELCGSADHLARAPIKLFEPCRGRVGVLRFIEALNQFRREPRAFVSGQFQKLGKNFATVRHWKDRSAVSELARQQLHQGRWIPIFIYGSRRSIIRGNGTVSRMWWIPHR